MIAIFEVQYEKSNPDNYQSRVIEEENWDVYIYKMKNGCATPRNIKPVNLIMGEERIEFDFTYPSMGQLLHHKAWKVQF